MDIAMRQSSSRSQHASAGPSQQPRAARRKMYPISDAEVIVLSDSDSDWPAQERPLKRQKSTIVAVELDAIDLTDMAGSSTQPNPSGSSKKGTEGSPKSHIKALSDLTNEPNHDPNPLPPVVIEAPKDEIVDPMDLYLSQILEVVPDVLPDHALTLVKQHITTYGDKVVETVLHLLFEDSSYPKIQKNKGKRKRDIDESELRVSKFAKKDYGCKERDYASGPHYYEITLNQLTIDFPHIPKPHIRAVLASHNNLYAPSYLTLRDQLNQPNRPFKLKVAPTKVLSKGKRHDVEFEHEREWLLDRLKDDASRLALPAAEESAEGEGSIECGCCFSDYPFAKIIQCPEMHLFCVTCMTSYVSNLLGQYDPYIKCMDQSGCKLLFTESELARFLPPKLLSLYHRVKQTKEIEAAGLEGLEECPFCEYKVVIDNPDERLFRCDNEDCGVVSCRACKKEDHLPRTCKEVDDDKGLDARHQVEEAMTEALMRNCPKCKKAFVKESGCNKMTCPHCRTLSCYVCRQVIKGYDHFDQTPSGQRQRASSSKAGKCLLWDAVEQRHDQEVAAARDRAIKVVEQANPEVDKKMLQVELPKAAPGPGAVAPLQPIYAVLPPFHAFPEMAHIHRAAAAVHDRIAPQLYAPPPRHLAVPHAPQHMHVAVQGAAAAAHGAQQQQYHHQLLQHAIPVAELPDIHAQQLQLQLQLQQRMRIQQLQLQQLRQQQLNQQLQHHRAAMAQAINIRHQMNHQVMDNLQPLQMPAQQRHPARVHSPPVAAPVPAARPVRQGTRRQRR